MAAPQVYNGHMKILAIDTTEQGCSAALMHGDELTETFEVAARQHSRLVLPMVERLLMEADLTLGQLDGLAFARGPGSFTGVRIAAAVTQGLAMSVDLPVVPVSSLLALAQSVMREEREERVLAAFDARMGELYWAPCESEGDRMRFSGSEHVSAMEEVAVPSGSLSWAVAGSAVSPYGDALVQRMDHVEMTRYPDAMVHAQDVATLALEDLASGRGVPAEQALPVYLRDQVAQKKAKTGS